jgi:prepilin-type N-terminal cleavage/methylation domain-containing protein
MNQFLPKASYGFTLIELLISMFIAGLILVATGALINGGANDSNRINLKADMLKEGQIAQQLINGRVGEAIYVWYPTGTGASNILLAASGSTTKNTINGNSSWQWNIINPSGAVNNVFLAMILPPRAPTYDAGGAIINCTSASGTASDGCYRYFAYYPVLRSVLANDAILALSEKPKPDPVNDNQWVIMEYRATLFNSTAWSPNYTTVNGVNTITGLPPASFYQGKSGVLLVDYVRPSSLKFNVVRPSPATVGSARADGTVEFSFQMQRLMGTATELRASASSADTMGATLSPRNWYCPRAISCP